MTASEANHQRVLALLLLEETEQYVQQVALEKENPALRRGKPPMSEARQPLTSSRSDTIRSNAS